MRVNKSFIEKIKISATKGLREIKSGITQRASFVCVIFIMIFDSFIFRVLLSGTFSMGRSPLM